MSIQLGANDHGVPMGTPRRDAQCLESADGIGAHGAELCIASIEKFVGIEAVKFVELCDHAFQHALRKLASAEARVVDYAIDKTETAQVVRGEM